MASQKAIMRMLSVLLLIMAFCPSASAGSSKKFEFLLHFFDMNEMAFAYHRHCLSRTENINETFLKALEFVADELFEEAKKDDPGINPEYIKNKLLERRYNIQYRLDYNNMKEGCYSKASMVAKEHYQEFSNYNKSEIREFIDEQTGEKP